jgi:hypothetical protein
MQGENTQTTIGSTQSEPHLHVVGGVSQLSCKKPLNSMFPYNLIICQEGLLFIKESFGDIMSVAGALGAGSAAGIAGYIAGRNIADSSMNNQITTGSAPSMLEKALADPHNRWVQVSDIASITVKKAWFVHKLTITLKDGTILYCGSKAGYNQLGNIRTYLLQAYPTLVTEI